MRRKRETASQMNQPTNQVKQRAYVCVCEEEMRKKREKRERRGLLKKKKEKEQHHP